MVRCGFPCSHFFSIIDQIHHMMVNVQYWKYFRAYYGDDSQIGQTLVQAQADQFDVEGMGIPITNEMLLTCKSKNMTKGGESFPILFPNTTKAMYEEAKYVSEQHACTYPDLDNFKNRKQVDEESTVGDYEPAIFEDNIDIFQSSNSQNLLSQVERVEIRKDEPSTQEEQTDARKEIITDVDFMIYHPKSCPHTLNILRKGINDAKEKALEYIDNQCKGNGRIKQSENQDGEQQQMLWAANTSKCGPVEVRKKNHSG